MPPLPNKEAVGLQTLRSDKEERTGEGDSSGYTEVKNNGDEAPACKNGPIPV